MHKGDRAERVIIIAPIGQDAAAIAAMLEAEGIQTEVSGGPWESCENLSDAGALLFTEEALELPQVSELLQALEAQPPWSELPLIILTSGGESRLAQLLDLVAAAARSVTLLERPMGTATLLQSVQVALRSRRRQYQVRELLTQEQALRGEAEAANRIKDEFLATVSNELRTPLNAIMGWATLASHDKLDEAMTARAIKTIVRSAKAQAQLIEDLLDVSRMIAGNLRLNVTPIKLTSVIKAAVDSLHPAAKAKGVQVDMDLNVAADRIQGDANRLQQVVWNLLSNAIKFTGKGKRVQIRLELTESQPQIIVSDTGEGISPEFLPNVFEPFRQADGTSTRRHGGLGLGLAIARRIVEMHGGSISVASAGKGQGATFTVSIPMVAARQTGLTSTIDSTTLARFDPASIDADLPSLSGIRVLAVDDVEDARDMLRVMLEQFGASVRTAGSAKEALEVLTDWKPDVLVSDIGMPDEDGYALIQRVRQLEAEHVRNIPAIALTGYARVEDRVRTLSAGYQTFVPKPVEANELAIAIASLIGRINGSSAKM
jgi:signal transduction histidine kinase/ActR/RegA family two-component response regulator